MDFDAASADAYAKPFPVAVDVEAIMARNIVKRSLVVGPLLVLVAWFFAGPIGAVSAAIGVGVVVANFLLAGWILSKAATISMQAYHVAALFGFIVRLGLITISMFAVAWMFDVDRVALGVSVVVSFLALLVLESIAMLRGARRDLEWN